MVALKITRLFRARFHEAFGTADDLPNAMIHKDALQSLAGLTYLIVGIKVTRYARLI